MKTFNFSDWRKRYATWMNHNKTRVMDFFRRTDTDHDGKVTRQEFIDGILESRKFTRNDDCVNCNLFFRILYYFLLFVF